MNLGKEPRIERCLNGHDLVTPAALPPSKKQARTDISREIKLLEMTEGGQGGEV